MAHPPLSPGARALGSGHAQTETLHPPRSRRRWRLALGAVGSCGLLAVLLAWTGAEGFAEVIRNLPLRILLLALTLQATVTALGAWRVWRMLRPHATRTTVLAIAAVHGAFLQFAPLRSGELVYVWLVRRTTSRAASRGLSQIVIFRVFDLLSVSVLAVGLLAVAGGTLFPEHPEPVVAAAVTALVLILAGATVMVLRGAPLLETLARWLARGGRLRGWLATRVQEGAQEFRLRPGQGFLLYAISQAMWAGVLGSATLVVTGAGVALPVSVIALVLTLQRFVFVIPFPALGTWGTMEVTWTAATVPLGVPPDLGAAAITTQHALVGLFAVAMAIPGALWLFSRWPRPSGDGGEATTAPPR